MLVKIKEKNMAKSIILKDSNNESMYPHPYFPIGSIYLSVSNTNPSKWFGGTWVQIAQGRTLVGVDTTQTEFNAVKKMGGSKFIQDHKHKAVINVNGNQSLEAVGYVGQGSTAQPYVETSGVTNVSTGNSGNLPPYLCCYIWCRTA